MEKLKYNNKRVQFIADIAYQNEKRDIRNHNGYAIPILIPLGGSIGFVVLVLVHSYEIHNHIGKLEYHSGSGDYNQTDIGFLLEGA